MKFREFLVWWIHKSLLYFVLSALGIGLTSLHDVPCLRPVTLGVASDLVVWPFSDSSEMGKRAQNKPSPGSSTSITTPVKRQRHIKIKQATPSKVSRELSRTKSDEAAARAVRLKLSCFPRCQVDNNCDDNGRHVEENVKLSLRALKPGKKHLNQTFWADIITAHRLTGTLTEALTPPSVSEKVNTELDIALKLCHHPNPASKSLSRLERLLKYHGAMNKTETYGLFAAAMESPTLSRGMATRMQEAILSWVGRVRADQEHKEYWSVVCHHYDRTLLETYHQSMADGMTRTAFLRSFRFQLQLFLCMGQATKVDMAVRAGEPPGSSDLESLRKSSAIGAELFATELRAEEVGAYALEIKDRIFNLEVENNFMVDEVNTFKKIMSAYTQNFEQATWESFVDSDLKVPFLGKECTALISNANDSWKHHLDARMKTVGLSSGDVPRLPHERWLFGESGPVPGAPETVHVPEELLYDMKNARDFLMSVIPDGFITAEKLKEEVRAHLASCKKADESFWLEEAFLLHGPFDEAITEHLRSSFLAVMPNEDDRNELSRDVVALRLLVHGDVVSAQKPELVKELKTAYSLLVDVMDARGVSASDAGKFSQFHMAVLKKAENYARFEVTDAESGVAAGDILQGAAAIKHLMRLMQKEEGTQVTANLKLVRSFKWLLNSDEEKTFTKWQADAWRTSATAWPRRKGKLCKMWKNHVLPMEPPAPWLHHQSRHPSCHGRLRNRQAAPAPQHLLKKKSRKNLHWQMQMQMA